MATKNDYLQQRGRRWSSWLFISRQILKEAITLLGSIAYGHDRMNEQLLY